MIRIVLHRLAAGQLVGTLTIDDAQWSIATWQSPDPGHVHATTTEGEPIEMHLGEKLPDGTRTGTIQVASGTTWLLSGCRFDGLTMAGTAYLGEPDEWMAGFLDRATTTKRR